MSRSGQIPFWLPAVTKVKSVGSLHMHGTGYFYYTFNVQGRQLLVRLSKAHQMIIHGIQIFVNIYNSCVYRTELQH